MFYSFFYYDIIFIGVSMMLFKKKNNSIEYRNLEKYKNLIIELTKNDRYISKKQYINYFNELKETYEKLLLMEQESVLLPWCKKQKINYSDLKKLIEFYDNTYSFIQDYNDNFVKKHMITDKEYLDDLLVKDDPIIKLDDEQRKVVLSDEDYTLVIAGAGAGKTTTIEAKVKYLVEKLNVEESRILIVSFTRKATNELVQRCKKLGLNVKISTFHSLANNIINNNEERYRIATADKMFSSIKNYLINKVNDEVFVKKMLLFFGSYLEVPIGENNIAVLFNKLNSNNYTTLKSDIDKTLDGYTKNQEKKHITIKDERVKSVEECRIANFLYINGINYQYEPVYKYTFNFTSKPYCPDFLIKQFDKEIYLEHFGISEDGKNNRYNEEELTKYKKHINDKILLHRKHGTKLIYTFSKYNDNRDYLNHLKEELIKCGISFEPKNSKEIYSVIIKNLEDKYFNKFIQLVCVFISRFKTNNYSVSKFDEWKISLTDERTKMFVDICYQCYLAYMTDLKKEKSIDFEDMINNASNILDKMIEQNKMLPYDYIFVDEYQDISMQRFDLCEKLSKCSNAKIIAVGDDWQSIFKFSGAKIELFTKFEEMMGYANVIKITNTYRNSQELIDIAGNFVMENNDQIKKQLKSNKSINNPIVLMSYDDSNVKDKNNLGPRSRLASVLEMTLDKLVSEYGEEQKILFIGRYGFEGPALANLKENIFTFYNGTLKSKKYPKLKLTYLTAHSSKGLGYDNVVIINAKDAIMGFPSKIEDDPVMKLVINDNDNYEYAEERRLFYVALTRTKNKVYIITPIYKPSQFILEIKEKYKNVVVLGNELKPIKEISNILKCPYCGYPLQRRVNNNFNIKGKIWVCSNNPEVCGFVTNDITGNKLCISKCPKCEDGYLIVKTVKSKNGVDQKMLGCSNYKADGTGCSTYLMSFDYTQDLEKLNIMFYDDKTDINKVTLCGVLFIDLVNTIVEIINYYSFYNIYINPSILFSFLSGIKTETVNKHEMFKHPKFDFIILKDKKKLYALLEAMKSENIISIDNNNHNKICVIKKSIDINEYKVLYASIK